MHTSRLIARIAVLALTVPAAVVGSAAGAALAAAGTYSQPGAVSMGQAGATAGGAGVTVNDGATATPYPSTTTIAGLVGPVTDVNLTLQGLTHANPADLDVMLVAPSGKRALVMSDAGGSAALTAVDVTLDDEATRDLPQSGVITSGSYRPTDFEVGDVFPAPAPDPGGAGSSLTVFDDADANGTWSLYVVDDTTNTIGGSITGWQLTVVTAGTQPYPSTITVAGAARAITDVNVTLSGLTHTSPSDIDIMLVGPGGQQATILSDSGADTDVSGVTVVLDDAAAAPVPTPLVSGTFQPTNAGGVDTFPAPAPTSTGASSLAAFNGTDPNGTWRLYVSDDAPGDTGALTGGWSLRITTDVVAPSVRSTTPSSFRTRVSRTANVRAAFTEQVQPRTVNRATVYLVRAGTTRHVRATVTYDVTRARAVLDPRAALRAHTRYRAFVTTGVRDLAGNNLDQSTRAGRQLKSWTFTTR